MVAIPFTLSPSSESLKLLATSFMDLARVSPPAIRENRGLEIEWRVAGGTQRRTLYPFCDC
jgi:hypothetical protein